MVVVIIMNRKQIGIRLREAREGASLSRDAVTANPDIGVSRTTLQQWENGGTEASLETIGKLAKLYSVTPQYLIFGDEEDGFASRLRKQWDKNAHHRSGNDETPTGLRLAIEDEYDYIPAYDVEVSAGNGAVCLGEATATKHLAFRKQWLKARGLTAKSLAALFTKGDSMTPTIPESAAVIIDQSRNQALDGKVYVIRIDDRHYVKRIQWLIGGGLRLISDNKLYDPLDITKADMEATNIEICGQVIHASYDLPD